MAVAESRPLSAADGAWWWMEHPTNLMTITGVFTFAEPFDDGRVRELAERLLRFDRFRQRVVPGSAFGRPTWEEDAAFDVARHVATVTLPTEDDASLQALVGTLMSEGLPVDRPLWQFHHVPSFNGGSVLIARVHHCIADGMSLVQVLLHLADEPPALPPVVTRARDAVASAAHRGVIGAAKLGGRVSASVARLLDLRADPRTPFRGPLGRAKRASWSAPIALDDVKAVGARHGATVNDVLLATVSGALRRYLDERGARADGITLRAVVPVNLRKPHEVALGNKFGLVFLPLPVGHRDPIGRLHAVKRAMDRIKRSPEALIVFGLLRAFGRTTSHVLTLAVNVLGRKATAVMTNVPGPREPVRFVGRAVDSLMFWVPQSGRLGLGVSILSYCGAVRVGIATDAGLVPDPERLVQAFQKEFEELHSGSGERGAGIG